MSNDGGNRGERREILAGHRREGKRFIPPLLDLPVKIDTYWRDVSIPELVWLALLVRRYGLRDAVGLAEGLASAAASAWQDDRKRWFAKASSYSALSSAQIELVLATEAVRERLEAYRAALDPLNRWYPTSPFAFVEEASTAGDIDDLKDVLNEMYDKTSVLAMRAQTIAIYVGFATNMLFIRKGMMLGELQLIEEYPHTDQSQQFGASVRASIGALIQGPDGADRTWPNAFWQRGFSLEPCQFPEIGDE
jgi:hypothetical protein